MNGQNQIVEQLKAGLQAVEEAEIPPELQAIAYHHALRVLAGGTPIQGPGDNSKSAQAGAENPLLVAISRRLRVDLDVVMHVFEEENGQVNLILNRARLPNPKSKAASMRDVSLLVVAGRQAAGIEDYTPAALIRHECEELGVLDPPNFSVELGRLGMRTRGGAKSREVHASRHQVEEAAGLMMRIFGGGEK
jgi:hypothetical protein